MVLACGSWYWYVPESCIVYLLSDSRVPLHLEEIKGILQDERQFLAKISPFVREAFVGACGQAPAPL
eukprot:7632768-Lingulodinium_polyedra.AAC.1